jgi:hypothetical protein
LADSRQKLTGYPLSDTQKPGDSGSKFRFWAVDRPV